MESGAASPWPARRTAPTWSSPPAALRLATWSPQEIAEAGGRALSLRCDVSMRADVEAAVAAAVEHFGGLDSMIHNALSFVGEPHEIQDVPEETWRSMVETGLRATYYCAQAAFAATPGSARAP